MKYLVDANALIWSQDSPELLATAALDALTDFGSELFISKATLWEIAIKVSIGKLQLSKTLDIWIGHSISDLNLIVAELELEEILQVATLPFVAKHRDPFDRLLAVQSLERKIPIISADSIFDDYSVTRIWH